MARLHLLREGVGEDRIASSFEISIETVKNLYGAHSVLSTADMPTFNNSPANPVSDPRLVVIELLHGELAFGSFHSPGFNILKNVDTMEVYRRLVEQKST